MIEQLHFLGVCCVFFLHIFFGLVCVVPRFAPKKMPAGGGGDDDDDDENGGGRLTLNIAGASSSSSSLSSGDGGDDSARRRVPKGNPRKRTVARGKKKWQGGKEKRKREGRTNPKDGITRDALGTTRKRPLVGGAGEETKRKNGRKRLVVAADESAAASGGSTWVKKPTTTTTTTREDANAEDAHLTAKERFLKNSREHRENVLAASSKKTEKESDLEIEKQQPKTREGEGEEEGDDDEEEEAFNPADWANLMKKATQKDKLDDDEANRDAAPHRDRVFDSNASTAAIVR